MFSNIVEKYDRCLSSLFDETQPGQIRSKKGKLVEDITKDIIRYSWNKLGGDLNRLAFGTNKVRIKMNADYFQQLPEEVRDDLVIDNFYYDIKVDLHCQIDGNFVVGVECKSYTENAMLKRILVDFWLIKKNFPHLLCFLVQLETFLGGENNFVGSKDIANRSSHTLMSYFPELDLNILTLLEGARHIKRPIHKREYAKDLKTKYVEHAVDSFSLQLKKFL